MTTDHKTIVLDLLKPQESLTTISEASIGGSLDPSLAAVLGTFFGCMAKKQSAGKDCE